MFNLAILRKTEAPDHFIKARVVAQRIEARVHLKISQSTALAPYTIFPGIQTLYPYPLSGH
jgi:hypothetical protein